MDGDDELTAEIKAQVEEWSSNANECFNISLQRGDGSIVGEPFNPAFTYEIFGEEEAIFGYQDLAINLTFAAHDLRPRLTVAHGKAFKAQGEVKPTDIQAALSDFLPEIAFTDAQDEAGDAASFTPPGEKIHSYTSDGAKFEIWCATLADARARRLLENMQILATMFIEGGSILQLEQDWTAQRWKLFLLYQYDEQLAPKASPYTLAGYGTSYRVFTLPDRDSPSKEDLAAFSQSLESFLPAPDDTASPTISTTTGTPLDLPSRERLSQFLILPPFQSAGHGQTLYTTLYTHLTAPNNIREFTVEDPNEAFDSLRDLSDLLLLRRDPLFASLRINTTIPPPLLASSAKLPVDLLVPLEPRTALRSKYKIQPRQFDRLVEMHTLSHIPSTHRGSRNRLTRKEKSANPHDREYYLWRLYVKQRLYIFNSEVFGQLERGERIEKLEGALDSVVEGYEECLEKVEAKEEDLQEEAMEGARERKGRKRKVVDEDEEEEEDGDEVMGDVGVNGAKKARVL